MSPPTVLEGEEVVRVYAPSVEAVDGCGAGATFSAGFIYGYLHGWNLMDRLRFATAAASLKVTRVGYEMSTVDEIVAAGSRLRVEQSQLTHSDLPQDALR